VIDRYKRVVRLNRNRGQWGYQRRDWYGERGFTTNKWTALEDRELAKMLMHRQWIACRAPASGIADRIGVDLDAKTPEQVKARTERYWRLRELMGRDRRPVVWRTPSGNGLRVYWRIPDTPLTALVTAQQEGLFADVLRGADLDLALAHIEVFPQPRHLDRLPLGARMPLLDPDTLEPIPGAIIGDAFDLDAVLAGLDVLERWHDAPHADLRAHLGTLPQVKRERPARPSAERQPTDTTVATTFIATTDIEEDETDGEDAALAPSLSRSGADFLAHGLAEPGTRLRALRAVGAELLRRPTAYGLPELPSKPQVAERMARWLAEKHNGQSRDWTRWLARHGGDVDATVAFVVADLCGPTCRGTTPSTGSWPASAGATRATGASSPCPPRRPAGCSSSPRPCRAGLAATSSKCGRSPGSGASSGSSSATTSEDRSARRTCTRTSARQTTPSRWSCRRGTCATGRSAMGRTPRAWPATGDSATCSPVTT
jgi:hypothetical protein